MFVVYIGGRRRKLANWFKWFGTPHRHSVSPLVGGEGSTMIVVGAGWPGRTSLGLFLPRLLCHQVSSPLKYLGGGGGCVTLPLRCSGLRESLWTDWFWRRVWTPDLCRLHPPLAHAGTINIRRTSCATQPTGQALSERALCVSSDHHNCCCTPLLGGN